MGTKSAEPADQLLVKVSPQRQRPTANLFKGLSRKREASVEAAGGAFFLDLASVVAEDL